MTPEQQHEQRLRALDAANDVRIRRAELKRELKAGHRDPLATLVEPPEPLRGMRIDDLLVSLPRVGPKKARKICTLAAVEPGTRLHSLSRYALLRIASHLPPSVERFRRERALAYGREAA